MAVELGDNVVDKVTGIRGIACSKTIFLNGCVQFGIMPKYKAGSAFPEEVGIDVQHLKVVKKKAVDIDKEDIGGAYTLGRRRGY